MPNQNFEALRQYIEKTVLIDIDENLKMRISPDMVEHFKEGAYALRIAAFQKIMKEISGVGLKYPGNIKPCLYIYLVPNDSFRELLNYPRQIRTNGGGKVVPAFEQSGFPSAYGASENIFYKSREPNFMQYVNHVHEIGHIIHDLFWSRDEFLCEGFAEALTLYILGYEDNWDMRLKALSQLRIDQIIPAQELIELSYADEFRMDTIIPNSSCSFEPTYISSYLFVRGCIKHLEKKYKINKVGSTQRFLNIIRQSPNYRELLVRDLAEALEIPFEELLYGKTLQLQTLNSITSSLAKNHSTPK